MLVELLARDAGLDGAVEIVDRDAQDAVHLRQVDAETALDGRDVAFEAGAGAEGDDRHLGGGAQPHRLGDLLRGAGVEHRIGRHELVIRGVLAVMLAYGGGGRETLAEARAQRVEQLAVSRADRCGDCHARILLPQLGSLPVSGAYESRCVYPAARFLAALPVMPSAAM